MDNVRTLEGLASTITEKFNSLGPDVNTSPVREIVKEHVSEINALSKISNFYEEEGDGRHRSHLYRLFNNTLQGDDTVNTADKLLNISRAIVDHEKSLRTRAGYTV